MTSARRLYRLHLALALLGGTAATAAATVALSRLQLGLPSGQALAAACRRVVPVQSGLVMLLALALAATGFLVFGLALRSGIRRFSEQRRILGAVRRLGTGELAGHEVTIFAGERPRAFCAGLVRARIYVSAAALRVLSPSELRAVVGHEAHHQAKRDPLRIFLTDVLCDALFFLPGLRRLGLRYRELAELAADEAATRSTDSEALASALLTFGARGGEAAAMVGIAPERVDHLLGETPRWQLPLSVFAGLLVTVAALIAAVAILPALASQGSLSLASVLAEGCMAGMIALPAAAVGGLVFAVSGRRLRGS